MSPMSRWHGDSRFAALVKSVDQGSSEAWLNEVIEHSKHLLLRPRQRKSAVVGVEASDARLLRPADEATALPDFAIGEHRQGLVHHRVAVERRSAFPFDLISKALPHSRSQFAGRRAVTVASMMSQRSVFCLL
jgi:hypothetical protein